MISYNHSELLIDFIVRSAMKIHWVKLMLFCSEETTFSKPITMQGIHLCFLHQVLGGRYFLK